MGLMSSRLLPFVFVFGCARSATEPLGSRAAALENGIIEREVGTFIEYDTPTTWAPDGPGDDRDRDGFVSAEHDGDPLSGAVAGEVGCNSLDQDVDGVERCPPDSDGDGVGTDLDCDDLDPDVGPLARETACDGRDQNCDGHDDCDADGDMVVDWDDDDPRDPSIPDRGSAVDEPRASPGW